MKNNMLSMDAHWCNAPCSWGKHGRYKKTNVRSIHRYCFTTWSTSDFLCCGSCIIFAFGIPYTFEFPYSLEQQTHYLIWLIYLLARCAWLCSSCCIFVIEAPPFLSWVFIMSTLFVGDRSTVFITFYGIFPYVTIFIRLMKRNLCAFVIIDSVKY